MCIVSLTACVKCHTTIKAQLDHCPPIKALLVNPDTTPWDIHTAFMWSPMEGCHGLTVHPKVKFSSCHAAEGAPARTPTRTRGNTPGTMTRFVQTALEAVETGVINEVPRRIPNGRGVVRTQTNAGPTHFPTAAAVAAARALASRDASVAARQAVEARQTYESRVRVDSLSVDVELAYLMERGLRMPPRTQNS